MKKKKVMIKEDFKKKFLQSKKPKKTPQSIKDLTNNIYNETILSNYIKKNDSSKTSIFETITDGWYESKLIVISSRPGMGKTTFVLNLTLNSVFKNNKSIAFFTLKEPSEQIAKRLFSTVTGFSLQEIDEKNLKRKINKKTIKNIKKLADAPIFVEDVSSFELDDVLYRAYVLKKTKKIDMLIIDEIQLFNNIHNKPEDKFLNHVATKLKKLAIFLDMPIVILSQLSRRVEKRGGDKRPHLIDIKYPTKIEYLADIVIALYRPEYYAFIEDEMGEPTKDVLEIIFLKQKYKPTKTIRLLYKKDVNKILKLSNRMRKENISNVVHPISF